MATIHRFVVVPAIPEKLEPLNELAGNVWSLWNYEAVNLFNRLDPDLWEQTNHNPVRLLNLVGQDKLKSAAEDEGFLSHLSRVSNLFHAYISQPTWFSINYPDSKAVFAYFSAEYGLHESLPIYSGGLGVLSGDHLKSASELGLPLVAIGLLYREGYFHQHLNGDGWQQEQNPENDFFAMPIKPALGSDGQQIVIQVEYPHGMVYAGIWKVSVGRVSLFLMDTNRPENRAEDRAITARLYGGDQDMRVRQEILLGIGGIRALKALGIKPTVCHMNEGHSAFLSLERTAVLMDQEKLSFAQAREIVASSNVFTTHTPVPAGNDFFPREMIEHYFSNFHDRLKLTREEFLALGRVNMEDAHESFGMTVLALRMAWHCNGVSELHGHVSQRMWQRIWPEVPPQEIPITSITNGVHTQSWLSEGFARLYQEYLGAKWSDRPADHSVWARTNRIPDSELWRTHERRKERLIDFARTRMKDMLSRQGNMTQEIQRIDEILDPKALTIGFARRFATYKRATLLMRNPDRLLKLLKDHNCPLQFIFAGKAHPRDDGGKRYIQDIFRFCQREDVRTRMVFIEDYDMNIARHMTQGVDVWLNTPRRPMEASGTSGMKAAINGVLNLSVLDGWWCEAYNGENGWAIGNGEEYSNDEYQDEMESRRLFDLLEKSVIPTYYDRGLDGLPRTWIRQMKNSIQTICPTFNTNRMVQQYCQSFYLPSHDMFEGLTENKNARGIALAAWKKELVDQWPFVRVRSVDMPQQGALKAGESMKVTAVVELGAINPQNVRIEIYYGQINPSGDIIESRSHEMAMGSPLEKGVYQYVGAINAASCGQQGFALRVLPDHPDIELRLEPRLIRWG